MNDYDSDRLLAMQRDGIRTVSGQHLGREVPRRSEPRWNCGCCMDQGCDFCNEVTDES